MDLKNAVLHLALCGALSFLTAVPVFATNDVWLTGSGSWSTNSDWSLHTPPGSAYTALFDYNSGLNTTGSVTVGSINSPDILFDGDAEAYTLGSGTIGNSFPTLIELGSTATSFTNSNVTETIAAPIIIASNVTTTIQNNSGTASDILYLGGYTNGVYGSVTGAGTLDLTGANTGANEIEDSVSAPMTVTKNGSGTWILGGSNTFTNTLAINAGTLAVTYTAPAGTAQPLGKGSLITLGVSNGTAGTLADTDNLNSDNIHQNVTAVGNGTIVSQSTDQILTLSGTLTNTNTTLTLDGGEKYKLNYGEYYLDGINVTGQITGGTTSNFNSNLDIVDGVTGLSSSTSNYTGNTNILNGGWLYTNATNALPTGTVVNMTGGGAGSNYQNVFEPLFNTTIGAINSSNDSAPGLSPSNVISTPSGINATLTITGINSDQNSVNSTFGGTIVDAYSTTGEPGALAIKVTGGIVTFTGSRNVYTGGTTIDGGTFLADNASGSATGIGDVIVNAGGTLGGSGAIIVGATIAIPNVNAVHPVYGNSVVVASGGRIAPGTAAVGAIAQNFLTFSLNSLDSNYLTLQAPSGATSGIAQLVFNVGSGPPPSDLSGLTFAGSSSYIKLTSDYLGEVQFNNNLVQIDDLTGGNLNKNGDYLLFQAGASSDYSGLTLNANDQIIAGLSLTNSTAASYSEEALFLRNGDIYFAAPEPSTYAMMLGGLALLGFCLRRKLA